MKYESNATSSEIATRLSAAKKVLILTHRKPDGDAMGSVIGLSRILKAKGVASSAHLVGPVQASLLALADDLPITLAEDADPPEDADTIVIVDTGAWSQLDVLADWVRERRDSIIGIDHHAAGDDVASMRIVDSRAASATQMLVDMIDDFGIDLTRAIAEPLFVGIATDTGWFKFQNADARCFRAAARLMDAGVRKDHLFQQVEEGHRPERLALEARALSSVIYRRDGRVAIQMLRPNDFVETGGKTDDITGIVNTPMVINGVRMTMLMTESTPGITKISLRGKPASEGFADADVNAVAAHLDGGGHVFAAGARVIGTTDEALAKLEAALEASGA